MPIRYLSDYDTTISNQLASDNARDLASQYAASYAGNPQVANLISANKARYPWMTPGVSLSLAKSGQGPDSPLTQSAAQATAERRASAGGTAFTGIGVWSQAGDFVGSVFSGIGSALKWLSKPVDKPLKAATRGLTAGLWYPLEGLESSIRDMSAGIREKGVVQGILTGSDTRLKEQSTLTRALPSFLGGKGESLGTGYFQGGPARENAINAQRTVYDVDGHVGTLGRIFAQHITEPGTRAFSLLSGTIDTAKLLVADPSVSLLRTATAARTASRLINPLEDMATRTPALREAAFRSYQKAPKPPSAPLATYDASAGLVHSPTRWTVDDNLASAWASTGHGARVMEDWAASTDTFDLMKRYKMDIETARRVADTASPSEALDIFQDRFLAGVIKTKPHATPRYGVTVKEHANSIRMFGSFSRDMHAQRSDLDGIAERIVQHGRNARLGESNLSYWVDRVARIEGPDELDDIVRSFSEDLAMRAAGQVDHTGAILGTNQKLKVGDKVYHGDFNSRGEVVKIGTRESPPPTSDPGNLPYDLTETYATIRVHDRGIEQFHEVAIDSLSKHLSLTRARSLAHPDFSSLQREFVDEAASGVPRTTLIHNGKVHDLSPIHPFAEDLTGTINFPDIRELRRATSSFGRVINDHTLLRGPVDMLSAAEQIWKKVTLYRAASVIRSLADDTARAGASGLTSAAHPVRHILLGTGARGDVDGFLANSDQFSEILAHSGRGSLDRGVVHHSRVFTPRDPDFASHWGDNLATMSRDPLYQKLAGNFDDVATPTGNPLLDSQNWFWNKRVPELRTQIDESAWPSYLRSRSAADKHVHNLHTHLQSLTKADDGLLEAVARGTINGTPAYTINPQDYASLTDDFRAYLTSHTGLPNMPSQVLGPRPLSATETGRLNQTVDRAFNFLWGKPTRYFIHNPALKDGYLQRLEELLPKMTPEAQQEAIKFATEALTESAGHAATRSIQTLLANPQIKRMAQRATSGQGTLSYREADFVAKTDAANRAKEIFYDLHNRSQFADAFRFVFPFFDAWKDMITTWSKISYQNPAVIRRFQTVVEGVRGNDTDPESGFFHIDPQTGNEVFSFPAIPFVTPKSIAAATSFQGSIAGLNMFSATPLMPGIGPIVQMPLGRILPDRPDTDWVRKVMMPYGTPTVGSTITPPWFDKISTAFNHDEHKDRNFANAMKDSARYLMSTGQYNLDDPISMRAMEDKARNLAKSVFYFRGLFQWLSPTPPSPDWRAMDHTGRFLSQHKMSSEYNQLVEQLGSDDGSAAFLNLFGPNNLLIMQGKSEGYSAAKQDTYNFMRENPHLLREFPDAFKYFAPQEGPDAHYEAYQYAFEHGTRQTLTYKEWVERANDRVGSLIYYNQKDNLGPKPTDKQLSQLSELRQVLTAKFPGFDPESNDPKRRERTIAQFYAAAATNDLSHTPAGRGIAAYLQARDTVIAQAARLDIKGWGSAKKTARLRTWLRGIADQLQTQYPGFDRAYESIFSREMVRG